jgi:hypothetical protein
MDARTLRINHPDDRCTRREQHRARSFLARDNWMERAPPAVEVPVTSGMAERPKAPV